MKKKILMFIFAFMLILPCAIFLSACGEKKEAQITDFNIVEKESGINHNEYWDKGVVYYGEYPVLDDYNLVLEYSDQTTKEVKSDDSKLSVKYLYTNSSGQETEISNLNNLGIGMYTIVYTYTDKNVFEVRVVFYTEKADFQNPYYLSLSQTSIQYGNFLPEITVVPSSGKVVEYGIRYLNQTQYDEYLNLEVAEQQEYLASKNQPVYDNFYGDFEIGEYYIYAEIASDNYNNKFSVPINLTVIPATIHKIESEDGFATATLYYGSMFAEGKLGNVKLGDVSINDFYANVRYEDQFGNVVPGSLQWGTQEQNIEINYNNNGQSFRVMFVPDSSNYVPAFYDNVELTVVKGEIFFQDIYQDMSYDPNVQNKTFTIYNNINTNFRPSDYIDVYKFDGSSWNKVTLQEGDYNSLVDTVTMQAGEHKYKLCLKDSTNFSWKINGETISSEDIEITKQINQLRINPDFEFGSGVSFNEEGYALISFKCNDDKLTNISVQEVNKDNNGELGDYFKGSAELVEIEGQKYIKYTPTGLYSPDGVLNNSSNSMSARAYFKIMANPINNNYYFETYEADVFVNRLMAGPKLQDTVDQPIELTPGKTYKECFTFMLPESLGTYSSSKINLDDVVPDVLTQTQLTLSFDSKSPIYYSVSALIFNVDLVNA